MKCNNINNNTGDDIWLIIYMHNSSTEDLINRDERYDCQLHLLIIYLSYKSTQLAHNGNHFVKYHSIIIITSILSLMKRHLYFYRIIFMFKSNVK